MTKQEFIDKYQGVLVNCRTEELAKEFLALAHGFGWKWVAAGTLLRDENYWNVNKEKTLYRAWDDGYMTYYSDVDGMSESFIVFESLKQLQQPQKSLLKSGDKVVYGGGLERYVLLETGTLHDTINGEVMKMLNGYCDNLIAINRFKDEDIMQVYRGDKLIMQHTEKSEKELKKEELQRKLDEIKAELEVL